MQGDNIRVIIVKKKVYIHSDSNQEITKRQGEC